MQDAIAVIVVSLAALHVGRTLLRTWTAPGGCGSGCGKCAATEPSAKSGRIPLA